MDDLMKTDSRYLHGEDLRRDGVYSEVTLTIAEVRDEHSQTTQQGKIIRGWPLVFERTDKILVLNKTNFRLAVAALDTNSRSQWIGKKLTVYPRMLDECFGQRNVICLRVLVPDGIPRPFVPPHLMGKDLRGVRVNQE